MSDIPEELQKFDAGNLVTMYRIEVTNVLAIQSIETFLVTPMTEGASAILYGGEIYSPIQMETEGFEWSGTGALPEPVVRLSMVNIQATIISALANWDDLVGARFTRIRTFEKFLDNGSEPDVTKKWPDEVYIIAQKVKQNKLEVEFKLQSSMDQAGTMLPRRDAHRDTCHHTYRQFNVNTNDFDYVNVTCPYRGVASFDINGNPTSASGDVCNLRLLTGCTPRFDSISEPKPALLFPGIARIR